MSISEDLEKYGFVECLAFPPLPEKECWAFQGKYTKREDGSVICSKCNAIIGTEIDDTEELPPSIEDSSGDDDDDSFDDDFDERADFGEVSELYEDATMSIEELRRKYYSGGGGGGDNGNDGGVGADEEEDVGDGGGKMSPQAKRQRLDESDDDESEDGESEGEEDDDGEDE